MGNANINKIRAQKLAEGKEVKKTHIEMRQQYEIEKEQWFDHPTEEGVILKRVSDFVPDKNLLFCIAYKNKVRESKYDGDYKKSELKIIEK